MVGSDTLVRAWFEGDWTIVEGAYFDCWRYEQHVVAPFEVPAHWPRFRSMDWGSAKPFSVGWWAIVSDDYYVPRAEGGPDRLLPRGALVRYREFGSNRSSWIDREAMPRLPVAFHFPAVA